MESDRQYARSNEWQRKLLYAISGMLIFETLTGLSILFLPFSVPNQVMVLMHTAVGLAFVIPFAWYQVRHWSIYTTMRMSHVKLTGYFAMVATIALVVSGLLLTYQAVFATSISYAWRTAHIVATFAFIASALPHIVVLLVRAVRSRATAAGAQVHAATTDFRRGTSWILLGGVVVTVVAVVAYRPPTLVNEFPEDYGLLYGEDRPFAPSLATTNTGGAFDPRSLAGSESCGTSGCHSDILKEWQVSAHRYSAMDAAFVKVQDVMAEQNGPESTRVLRRLSRSHLALLGNQEPLLGRPDEPSGYQEGVSCLLPCHREHRRAGQRQLHHAQPDRYMFDTREGRSRVRARLLDPRLSAHTRPSSSTRCSRARVLRGVPQAVHRRGDQQGRLGATSEPVRQLAQEPLERPGDPEATIECRECHMPLIDSTDPASATTSTTIARRRRQAPEPPLPRRQPVHAVAARARGRRGTVRADREVAARRDRDPGDRRQVESGTGRAHRDRRPRSWRPASSQRPVVAHQQQGRPRLSHGSARHHPGVGRDRGHRRDGNVVFTSGSVTKRTSSSPDPSCSRPSRWTSTATSSTGTTSGRWSACATARRSSRVLRPCRVRVPAPREHAHGEGHDQRITR